MEKANLRQIRIHDLRNTYATLLLQAGAPITYVSHQLGHRDASITARLRALALAILLGGTGTAIRSDVPLASPPVIVQRQGPIRRERIPSPSALPGIAEHDSSSGPKSGLTMENYLRLKDGMSYAEVSRILGEPGEEMSRSDIAGYSTVMYGWKRWTGANMNAMFQNGRLVTEGAIRSGLNVRPRME